MNNSNSDANATNKSSNTFDWLIAVGGIGTIGLLVWATILTNQYASSADRYQELRDKITLTTSLAIGGSILLGITIMFYFMQYPQKAMYIQILMTSLATGLSLAALSAGAISRSAPRST